MNDFYTEIIINALPAKVWEAFTAKNGFFKSFYGAEIRSSFKVGEKLEFVGQQDGADQVHIYGEVLEFVPEKILAYTDHPGPLYHEDHEKLESRVKMTLEPLGQACRLALNNDQFSPNNPMAKEAQQWYLILSNLKTFVETGELMKIA